MEKRIQKLVLTLSVIFFAFHSYAQDVSQERLVRFNIWALSDFVPGTPESLDEFYAIKHMSDIACFISEGMVYGWSFEYSPSDKARNVKEYFEYEPITKLSKADRQKIRYAKPWVQDARLCCWVEYDRSEGQIMAYRAWRGIEYPRIKGTGYAKLSDGFAGIQKACGEALKEAVRDYERSRIKNKPREITGKVLISQPPKIGIDAGQYKVTLDFFIETDRIKEYKMF